MSNLNIFKYALLALALMLPLNCAFSQNAKEMGTTELKDAATDLIEKKDYVGARPYLEQLIIRINDSDDKKLKVQLPDLYFFMAYGYMQESQAKENPKLLEQAIANFDKVLSFPEATLAIDSIKAKADCYNGMKEFVKAAEARAVVLRPPHVNKLSLSEQLSIIKQTATSFYNARKFADGQNWFKLLMEKSKEGSQDQVFAASALIQGALEAKKYDAAMPYLKYLSYDVPARSDIGLNYSMLMASDELVKTGKFSDAALFLSLVLERDELLKNIEGFEAKTKRYLDQIKKNPDNPNIPEMEAMLQILAAQKAYLKDLKPYKVDLRARAARNYSMTKRDYESYWSYRQLYRDFPNHNAIEDFYFAAFAGAFKIKKNEDLFEIGSEYLEKFPNGRYKKEFEFYLAQYYLNKKDYGTFFQKANEYVVSNPDEQHSVEMVFLMGRTWMDLKKYDDLIKTFTKYDKEFEASPMREGCMYWIGMAYMVDGKYEDAAKWFGLLVENYPMGSYAEDATYRKGVAEYGSAQFTKARDTFEGFIHRYGENQLAGEVEFFLGDIYAGVGEVDIAMKHYNAVEERTKNMAFIDNAYSQSAKLLHSFEMYERERELMDRYLEKYPDGDVSNISFNKAAALEMMGRPVEALKIYYDTILKCGDNAKDDGVDKIILDYKRMYDHSLEMTKATVEFLDKMIKDADFRKLMTENPGKRYQYFQANPKIDRRIYLKLKNDGSFREALARSVKPIKDMYDTSKKELDSFPKGGAEAALQDILQKAVAGGRQTLEYRAKMGMHSYGMPVKVDKVFTADDLKKSSVRTLVWIGTQNEKYGADEARKAFAEAASREEVAYELDVLFANADLESRQGGEGIGKAIDIYSKIEEEYPLNERAAEAALNQAALYVKLGDTKKAYQKYEKILKYPAYRGEPFAEALYNLGLLSERDNRVDDALMWYDRCFLGYANCFEWSGKAVLAATRLIAKTDVERAKKICDEFLENARNKRSPEYGAVRTFRNTL